MKPRGSGPGVVKVKFRSVQEKIARLRGKQKLKSHPIYEKVFIRSAKSHTDRLIELNFRTLLREIPGGKDYFITGSGRVQRRDGRDTRADNTPSSQP
ncbi:Hypp4873 [Branchiostoma lanceolatum]|uniref:Hypp4873 protein n=1 Tax=Branchiostoma lanceolatum TaxID=7740 RepID=A0A8K0AAV4_BRALA|nr:Hypp4873 [Branchiostoma lanceolatum]